MAVMRQYIYKTARDNAYWAARITEITYQGPWWALDIFKCYGKVVYIELLQGR
jgi:hypothetical protein